MQNLREHAKTLTAIVTIPAAFIMWYLMFVMKPMNFWFMMSITTSVMIVIAATIQRPLIKRDEITIRNIFIGIISAFILYGIFFLGDTLTTLLMPSREADITTVYDTRSLLDPALIACLLFFPIGAGEELFWRGFLQQYFSRRISHVSAFFIIVVLYTGVHVVTGNIMLIVAAFVCGIFWGGLYLMTGSVLPCLISHMIWDPLIFILFPVR